MAEPLPVAPRGGAITVRVGTMADLPWMDALQKKHSKQLGYFPTKQFEGYITAGHVLIAETSNQPAAGTGDSLLVTGTDGTPAPGNRYPVTSNTPLGYCISKDRYLKRDELGVFYQLCVAPHAQRGLIGATLVREVFARSAYGCKLYCCWCAQDLAANHFWESMGFVPVAFRAGSGRKRRVHIFWQRRINADDVTTPYWYPSMTNQGAIREDRIVFPIPPGVHWSEVVRVEAAGAEARALEAPDAGKAHAARAERKAKPAKAADVPNRTAASATRRIVRRSGLLRFATAEPTTIEPVKPRRAPKAPAAKERATVDPALLAQARELRDRWMERANERGMFGAGAGKYLVARTIDARESTQAHAMPDASRRMALPAA